jgi:type IV pilus assembly protein PilY1
MSTSYRSFLSLAIASSIFAAGLPEVSRAATAPLEESAYFPLPLYQQPTVVQESLPPLNMLVLGRDHKLYYEAYNDSSDLNEDGELDVGYRGDFERIKANPLGGTITEAVPAERQVTYYGLFDSYRCYLYGSDNIFTPTRTTTNKRCGGDGEWSGDFLNYLTTSRIDALKKVLYGGTRHIDTTTRTVLERVRVPQDGHSWGKEYSSPTKDGYQIRNFAPFDAPISGARRHLFASTSLNDDINTPRLRILPNSTFRIWNWVSIEGPVAGDQCDAGSRRNCTEVAPAAWNPIPATAMSFTEFRTIATRANAARDALGNAAIPNNAAEMNTLFTNYDVAGRRLGSNPTLLSTTGVNFASGNGGVRQPFNDTSTGGFGQPIDQYGAFITGTITPPTSGEWRFAVDGDDAVELVVSDSVGNVLTTAAWYGGHGMCANSNATDTANLAAMSACAEVNTGATQFFGTATLTGGVAYNFRFRHHEGGGGDGYRILWTNAQPTPVSQFVERNVRVEVCKSEALKEANCLQYADVANNTTTLKPTGLLHEFGQTDRMYFGLMTGSFAKNTEGGVLRRNVGSFKDELHLNTGIFRTNVTGIVKQLDSLRIAGYPNTTNRNSNSGYTGCAGLGWRPIDDGECSDWGNPIGEMVYETVRYYAGATQPAYNYTQGGSVDDTLGLVQPAWKDPYKSVADGGLGFRSCALPFATVISDLNPSYDSNLPGSTFTTVTAPTGTPTLLSAFDYGAQAQDIWTREGFGTKNIFIGQSGSVNDGVPSAKSASSFGTVRGLAPEEPTKEGGFSGAAAAMFARNNDISAIAGAQNMQTFAVALTSPLPRIAFPIGDQTITLIPFAKSVAHVGNSGRFRIPQSGDFRPTNTIVDFYIADFVNMAGGRVDATVNGGRPYAEFRINYEDVEQGNDHDMDAIVIYRLQQTVDNRLSVDLQLEYQAGSVTHHMGYIISGTTRDGPYLEIVDDNRDEDASRADDFGYLRYKYDTPPGKWSGECVTVTNCPRATATNVYTDAVGRVMDNNNLLPVRATRIFSPGTGATAELLKDPLWVMAKYGGSRRPAPATGALPLVDWDEDTDGVPDNYFLVTNALTLADRLRSAFIAIENRANPAGSIATSSSRVDTSTFVYRSQFEFRRGTQQGWFGDIDAFTISVTGDVSQTAIWRASVQQPAGAGRNIYYWDKTDDEAKEFDAVTFGAPANIFRDRPMADIVNSLAAVAGKQDFGYCRLLDNAGDRTCTDPDVGYIDFLNSKLTKAPLLLVGTNDGLLRVINGNNGNEVAAYMPSTVLEGTSRNPISTDNWTTLTQPNYANRHRYFMDGPVTIGDVTFDPSLQGGWKTVAVATAGAGGRSVVAIDVTDGASMDESNFMWEFQAPELGYPLGSAKIVRLNNGKFAAIFGNGVNSANDQASLFIVDMETGDLIRRIDTLVGTSTTEPEYSARPGVNDFSQASGPNGLSTPSGMDEQLLATGGEVDADATVDRIYAGDLRGNLWRFDVSSDDPDDWEIANGGDAMFVTDNPMGTGIQPISSAPAIARHPVSGVVVAFGTGRYDFRGDEFARPEYADSYYAIRDDDAALAKTDLQVSSLTGPARGVTGASILSDDKGWYIDFSGNNALVGERVLAGTLIRAGAVFFNTFAPGVRSTPCDPSPPPGGFLMAVDLLGGFGRADLINTGTGATAIALPVGSPKAPPTIVGGGGNAERPLDILILPDGTTQVLDTRRGRQSWRQLR